MKKINVLGKQIPALVIGVLLMASVGSAALVGYISNTITTNVVVTSPIVQEASLDGNSWMSKNPITLSFPDVKGGESITFYVKDTNVANVPITGVVENIVTNPSGVNCEDFESVIVTTTTVIDGGVPVISGPHDLILYNSVGTVGRFCKSDGLNKIIFSYGPDPLTLDVKQEDTSEITATFKTAASGTYTFTSTILPVS